MDKIEIQKKKLCEHLLKYKNVRSDTVNGLPFIDPMIWDLVKVINKCSCFATEQCCQGHSKEDLLVRQEWFDVEPSENCAHISFDSEDRLDEEILFHWSKIFSVKETYMYQRRYYVIWWQEPNTLKGMQSLIDWFSKYVDEELEDELLLDKIMEESAKQNPQWLRGAHKIMGEK